MFILGKKTASLSMLVSNGVRQHPSKSHQSLLGIITHIRAVSVGAWGADVIEQMELCGCSSTFPRLLADGTELLESRASLLAPWRVRDLGRDAWDPSKRV